MYLKQKQQIVLQFGPGSQQRLTVQVKTLPTVFKQLTYN